MISPLRRHFLLLLIVNINISTAIEERAVCDAARSRLQGASLLTPA